MESAARLATLATATGAPVCGTAIGPDIDDPGIPESAIGCVGAPTSLAGAGVRLAIEFLPYSCVASVADAWELCDAVGWDAAGLLVDSWHTLVTGQVGALAGLAAMTSPWCSTATVCSPRPATCATTAATIGACRGVASSIWPGFVAAVVATGYDGIVSPEVLSAEVRAARPPPSPPHSTEHSASTGRVRSVRSLD